MKNRHFAIGLAIIISLLTATFISIKTLAKTDAPSILLSRESNSVNELSGFIQADPIYALSDISLDPYPILMGQPTEVCVRLHNPTDIVQELAVSFSWANFGIGLPFMAIGGPQMIQLPANSVVNHCIHWVPPITGHVCLQVEITKEGNPPIVGQRNVDVSGMLQPGVPYMITFPVGNPFENSVTITLGLVPHLPDWGFELSQDVLPDMNPGEVRPVTLTVTPPAGQPLPPDNTPIVDVEAYADNTLIGGFRKVFRPPVPLHSSPDPSYAEREITIDPYPPMAGEPTEICVTLRNPTSSPQEVLVTFSWANFGVGLPFTPMTGAIPVELPPNSIVKQCVNWVPPTSGHFCVQVMLEAQGYLPQFSQRNLDVNELLQPGEPDELIISVGNPFEQPVTITLGLIPHSPGWGFELSQDVLPDMNPGEIRPVVLTVTPPAGEPLPPDNTPIVDVEAYADNTLIGGFRKVFRPPVPLHSSPDPSYAEREITVHPYPPMAGEPTEICVTLRNPTSSPQEVVVTFSLADFGIALPFTLSTGAIPVQLPPYSIVKQCVNWEPPTSGHFCVQVMLEAQGYLPQFSQRNLDVVQNIEPGAQYSLTFSIGNPFQQKATINLGLIPLLPGWGFELSQDVLPDMNPGEVRPVTLTVTPPPDQSLPPHNTRIVDVEAYAEGNLVGGVELQYWPSMYFSLLPLTMK